MESLINESKSRLQSEFGCSSNEQLIIASAPGRVNLIGEHTDYNKGFVFPIALPLRTLVVGYQNNSDEVQAVSLVVDGKVRFNVSDIQTGDPFWGDYFKGVVAEFQKKTGKQVPGFNAVFHSNVPLGGGVSSSASMEVATATFLEALTGITLDPTEKALLCQAAEHNYPNNPCGIMDQFISVHGKADHALLIDCLDESSKLVNMPSSTVCFFVINSNVKHKLSGENNPFAERQKSCFKAAEICGKDFLRRVTLEDLEKCKSKMDQITYNRALHGVQEDKRTLEAAEVLIKGDFKRFGELMNASHDSLRDLYEVSCPEVDELVEIARKIKGVYGSRITGGGFGGCTVTLIEKDAVQSLKDAVNATYSLTASFFDGTASDGAKIH